MRVKYKPAKGAMFDADDAEALGRVMEQLGEHIKPEQLVDAARPAKSPIHGLFQWDDTAAAELYRRGQARQHISHLEIVIETDEGQRETKAYHSVVITSDDTEERGYSSFTEIRASSELSEQVIERAMRELQSWKQRYTEYQAVFTDVFKAIGKAKRKMKAVA
jgi:hypothetical protein